MGLFIGLIALLFFGSSFYSFFFLFSFCERMFMGFSVCFCLFSFAFTICLGVLSVLFGLYVCSIFFFFFLPLSLPYYLACGVFVLQPSVVPEPLRWKTWVQDLIIRSLPTSWNIHWQELSQRPPSQHQDLAPLKVQQATVLDASHQITSKTGAQTHPLDKLPKAILNSQTPQNTPLHIALP